MHAPPPDLPAEPSHFYGSSTIPELPAADPAIASALDQLGACPIPKYKFPLLGFLSTVYEHVSNHAKTILVNTKLR